MFWGLEGLEGLERGTFCRVVFRNPGGTGGTAFAAGGGKLRSIISWFLLLKKNVAVHNDLTNLKFHLKPVEGITVNLISILICGRKVQWYVNNKILLVIVQHVIQSIQMCSTCQKFKMQCNGFSHCLWYEHFEVQHVAGLQRGLISLVFFGGTYVDYLYLAHGRNHP